MAVLSLVSIFRDAPMPKPLTREDITARLRKSLDGPASEAVQMLVPVAWVRALVDAPSAPPLPPAGEVAASAGEGLPPDSLPGEGDVVPPKPRRRKPSAE